ncbi:MAG TPA: FAD-dependent oxidoreductase [Candidatus Saccharimonadales bacterium]|nr:FAD-dependent oxidoreductase [Candidatus Saccharimonadales bacterium]
MIQSQTYTIKLTKKILVAKDTYSFYFKRPKEFNFISGQYNRWTLPINATDGRGSSRFFTISSPPSEKESLVVTTKIIQSDFKNALLNLEVGQEIKIFGPMGQFIIDETHQTDHVFIAGGIGITPFYSMLMDASTKKSNKKLTLLASFSTTDEIIFLNELEKASTLYDQINVVYTITQPQKSQTPWDGQTGRISEELIKKYVNDIPTSIFYIVGPPSMVEEIQTLLKKMNVPNKNIKTEQFTGY